MIPCSSSWGQLVHISQDTLEINLSPGCQYFVEKKVEMSIEEVENETFVPLNHPILNFGNSDKAVWIKFTLSTELSSPLTLELGKPHLRLATLYEPSAQSYIVHQAGVRIPIEQKDYEHNRLWFRIKPFSGIKTFFIRLQSPNKTLPIVISTEKVAFEKKGSHDMFFGISFGILFMALIYTSFLYFSGSGQVYLYYMGYILFVNLSSAFLVGFTPAFLTNALFNLGEQVHVLMALSAICLTLFSASFLEIRKHFPAWYWPVYVLLGLEGSTILLSLMGQEYIGSIFIQIFTTCSALYLIPISIAIYRKGERANRFYIVAWLIGWAFIMSYLLTINSVFPMNFINLNGVLLGSIAESILFSIALADKMQFVKKEAETSNKEMLKKLQDNEKLIIKQKEELAALVGERTKELADKNTELEKYSKGLETLVVERAREIIKMNDELKLQNQRLEQYTFIAAHNIRGPVARIQGLLYLLSIEDDKETHVRKEIIQRLEKSTHELDSIVKDLSFLLEIDRDLQSGKTVVHIPELFENVLNALEAPLNAEEVFELHFETKDISSFRPLLYSIFYNLISNSYKFRNPERPLQIALRVWEDKRYYYFSIKDNGLGMDAAKFRRKLFSPYQRFHPQIEGKGIGLFLVKTQVDALGGSMELKSEPNVGTEVTITLIKQA
ncbi:MAG: sensor histidine kinase [Cytophagaceae bacterium]|jgi:signal transduction histidine kinase|nr:sensor histidine kinase [Cytophagaceae bacterium]